MSEITNHNWDIVVIGGGAAGLMAAASAAGRGRKVLLLEKNTKLGVKILMSGGTRCNITHDCGIPGIIDAFGRQGKFLHSALAALPPQAVIKKIEGQGVATKTESTGKIFPVSNKALDVRDALVRLATQAGATLVSKCAVTSLQKIGDQFQLTTSQGEVKSSTIIVTTGGKSYPGCGTTGDGYGWATQFGHTIVDTVPALTPLLSSCQWAHALKGITIDPVDVRVIKLAGSDVRANASGLAPQVASKKNKPQVLAQRRGSFLFTHWGFSGPCVLDVSREVARHRARQTLELVCDFLPDVTPENLLTALDERKLKSGKQSVANLLNDFFPRRLQDGILSAAGVSPALRTAEIPKKTLSAIAAQIKNTRFPISGTLGFEKAEVTSGGVKLSEVDGKTMRSKLIPGLYFAGEILDLDGYIGGFNFQSAFSTGWLAGHWA